MASRISCLVAPIFPANTGVDHRAGGELDAGRLADHLQFIHDVKHTLSGDVILDNQVDTEAVVVTARHQDVPRKGGEDADPPVSAKLDDLVQCRIHRPEEDEGVLAVRHF
jgi:hypothetical protein